MFQLSKVLCVPGIMIITILEIMVLPQKSGIILKIDQWSANTPWKLKLQPEIWNPDRISRQHDRRSSNLSNRHKT